MLKSTAPLTVCTIQPTTSTLQFLCYYAFSFSLVLWPEFSVMSIKQLQCCICGSSCCKMSLCCLLCWCSFCSKKQLPIGLPWEEWTIGFGGGMCSECPCLLCSTVCAPTTVVSHDAWRFWLELRLHTFWSSNKSNMLLCIYMFFCNGMCSHIVHSVFTVQMTTLPQLYLFTAAQCCWAFHCWPLQE